MDAIELLVKQLIPKLIERVKTLEAKQVTLETQVAELAAGIAKKPGARSRGKKATEEKTAQPATGWTGTTKDPQESVVNMDLVAELDKKYADPAQAQPPVQADYLEVTITVGDYNYIVDQQAIDNVKAALINAKGDVEAAAAALQTPMGYVQEVARIAMERKQKQQGE